MTALFPDTEPEAEQVLIELLRRAPVTRKLEMLGQMNAAARQLALAGLALPASWRYRVAASPPPGRPPARPGPCRTCLRAALRPRDPMLPEPIAVTPAGDRRAGEGGRAPTLSAALWRARFMAWCAPRWTPISLPT